MAITAALGAWADENCDSASMPQLAAMRGVAPDAYDFWLYAPQGYSSDTNRKYPLFIFLHGASCCGSNMNRSLRYGPINAMHYGLKLNAMVIAPQNTGGSWKPARVKAILDWAKQNCRIDADSIYVLGMSLGGYGTMDFVGTYPGEVAAAMALCGGCSLKDVTPLGDVPLWIIHGTADRAVTCQKSKSVVNTLKDAGKDSLLRYEWIPGMNHSQPARYFYCTKTYEWLMSHSLSDNPRRVNREIDITAEDRRSAYRNLGYKPVKYKTVNKIK